ncbi:MAG: PilZ domain-containing protein, partial [Pseudobdellovibrionaceae bacterium]
MGQLIDITARLKQKANESENVKKTSSLKNQKAAKAPVFDLEEPRLKKKEEERREVKRTILSEFISAFVVLPEKGLKKVAIYDISDSGVSFDVPMEDGAFAKGEEIALRIYLNQLTYYPFIVRVA